MEEFYKMCTLVFLFGGGLTLLVWGLIRYINKEHDVANHTALLCMFVIWILCIMVGVATFINHVSEIIVKNY